MRANRVANRRGFVNVCLFSIAFGAAVLAGCNQDENADQTASADGAAELAEFSAGPPPNNEECAAFGEELARGMREGDVSTFNRLVDWDAIFRRAEHGLDMPAKEARQFRAGVRAGVGESGGLAGSVAKSVREGGDFRYVRTRNRGSRKTVLTRLAAADGLNYIEFPLARRANGQIVATDFYIYLSGENFSQTVRRILLMILAAENRSFVDRIVGKETDFVRHIRDVQKLSGALASSDFPGGLAAYKRMPESLQREKFVLMQRMLCAQQVSEDEYLAAMEDLRKHFPDDPCIDFISIDAYVLRGEVSEAIASLDRLSKALDGDAALETLRANLHLEQGDYKAARDAAGKAVDGGDVRPDPYYVAIVASLREQQHDETLDLLKQVAEKFDLVQTNLESNAEYAQFIRSPQYQAWQEYVAMHQPKQPSETPIDGIPFE